MDGIDWKYLYTSNEGRIGRRHWWIGVGVLFLISILTSLLFGGDGLVPFVIGVLLLLAGLFVHIKRCHDRGKSGWWCILLLIPVVGAIWAVIDLGILKGTEGPNRFGPAPLHG